MLESVLLNLKLLVVQDVRQSENEAAIAFVGGLRGTLSKNLGDYAYFLRLAERSKERKQPVGVGLSKEGVVTTMSRADSDVARSIGDADKDRAKVWFTGHDGTYFLRRSDPDYKRLSELVRRSIASGERLWFAATSELVLEDAALEVPAR
jgi:hypothetical protein